MQISMLYSANHSSLPKDNLSKNQNSQIVNNINDENSGNDIAYNLAPPDSNDKENPVIDTNTVSVDTTAVIVDTTTIGVDSTKIVKTKTKVNADSLRIVQMGIDSTNRLKYFHYQREDLPYVPAEEKKPSGFFIQPSPSYKQRTVTIDSTGKFVEVREKVAGQETKVALRMPLDDYIKLKLALRERRLWEDLGYQYELKSDKLGLGELITNLTDFEIPLPKVGVLSIFGEPKISLKIGGSVQIHGAWRNETTQGVTASRLGNTRNEPDFKQQVQINVNGTIGDKLNISADWNTERTFQYENQLKIKYTGYEDEIIQSVEAGNVSMETSPLVGGAEALFGIKAKFKMGPFSLTTLASQKKGETKEVSVSGGATSTEYSIRAYNYSENHYFIDKVYADSTLFSNFFFKIPSVVDNNLTVNDIEVWKSVNTIVSDQSKLRYANAYLDLAPLQANQTKYSDDFRKTLDNPKPGEQETGRFQLLERGTDYELHPETGFISFKTSIQDQDVIAIAFKQGPNDITYGEFIGTSKDTILVLKLVKPKYLKPQYTEAWQLQLKNIYPTGSRNINKEGFDFRIKYEVVGQDPTDELQTASGNVKLLQAFGLDQQGEGGNANPDDVFDWRPGYTIFPETGEIIFPMLEPFGKNIPPALKDFTFQLIYDTTKTFAQQDKIHDKWDMTGKQTGTASATYPLGFNVVENSVRVLLGGRELTPGVDYIVDYTIGQITIRNDAALVPGADLKITYEQNDLFQLASKTLLGARGLYQFSNKTQLGFTIMNLNQQTLSDKVRIGEEPLSNTIYGVDFKTGADLPFLTTLLDNVISTREMSSMTFSGEYAYMNPDPNTKKSTISSDDGKSIAYIDDFEGTKKTIPIGIGYTGWKDLSPPDMVPGIASLTKGDRMHYKAKSFWYNVTPSYVTVKQIYGTRKQVAKTDQQETVLDFVYIPDSVGTYNWDPTDDANLNKRWGGAQKILSSTANNLVEQNVDYVEFWMHILHAPPGAKLYLDMGLISEDVIPDGKLNTEDKNLNELIDDGEDTGLDTLFDSQERTHFPNARDKSDPSGDNFRLVQVQDLNPMNYYNINGTEGNAVLTDVGRLPDTEDLNRNGSVDLTNSYFRYEIPIDTTSANPFIAGGGFTDSLWYLVRVPLKDTLLNFNGASLSNVETMRLFVTGVSQSVHIQIAEFNLVGSQWQKLAVIDTLTKKAIDDSVLSISVVSQEENLNYTSPPGVFRERDRTNPNEQIYKNEQSMNLILKDLPDGQSREAVKYLYRPLDVFSYSEMKLFIHGDDNNSPGSISNNNPSTGEYSSEVFFRFGTDTNNYYEYRQPVGTGWNSVDIKFDELTAIKNNPRNDLDEIDPVPVPDHPGHFYGVRGNPTLTAVRFLTVGIYNPPGTYNQGLLSGEIWVNELRVVGADDKSGWAYTLATSLKLADLMTVNFNISNTNPYFHRLAERFGSRIETRNWNFSASMNVLKLLPFNMPQSSLQLNVSHSESVGKPLYVPGTDIRVDEAARQLTSAADSANTVTPEQFIAETQTVNVSNSISASNIKLVIPTDLWYIRDSFNALTFGFNYNNAFSRSPTIVRSSNWKWNANMNYGVNLSNDLYFKPANIPVVGWLFSILDDYKDLKIYYAPQNFAGSISASRNRNSSLTRVTSNIPSKENISRDFTASRGFNFGWKVTDGGLLNLSTSYNLIVNSSLQYLLTDKYNIDRSESQIWNDILSGEGFGKDYSYQQSVDFRLQPRLPSLWDINKYFTLTGGYHVAYSWQNNLRIADVGRSAGFSSSSSVGLVLRWKSLTEPLFQSSKINEQKNNTQRNNNKYRVNEKNPGNDSTGTNLDSLLTIENKPSSLSRAFNFFKLAFKALLFDWDNFTFNFSNNNSVSSSGLKSEGTGFSNFWGLTTKTNNGPSRAFMLGLSKDVGPRVLSDSTNLSDAYAEKNSFDFRTSRPLWEGAKIDVTWKVSWGLNKNTTITADEFGNLVIANQTSTGTLSRSFLSLPLPLFDVGIKKVHALYNPQAEDPKKNLSDAFVQGFETLNWFKSAGFLSDIVKYIPRANWRFTWDGLEKFPLFKAVAQRVSLEHSYSSDYIEGWKLTTEGKKEIQTQKISYGFTPLVGLNITFGQLWGGNLSGNIKYATRSSYDLGVTASNITETFSKDIGFSASYSKSGFELPLFGISLKNDIEFTLSYTLTQNSNVRFDMDNFTEAGTPQDGTTRTSIEPRIRYTISSKVTISLFYKRSSVEPEGAARISPTTTNEAGLDVNILIQ